MSHLLKDIYGIEETNGALNNVLDPPYEKYFYFDLDSITKENNLISNVIWNFGDPDGIDNEIISPSVIDSAVCHTFTYEGLYKITTIATVNGTLFHDQQDFIIGSNDVRISPSPSASNENITVHFRSFYETDKIYYTISSTGGSGTSPLDINAPDVLLYDRNIGIVLESASGTEAFYTINYCGYDSTNTLINQSGSYDTKTYNIDKQAPTIQWVPEIVQFLLGPSVSGDLTITITSLIADSSIKEFLINDTGTTPVVDDLNWSTTKPTSYTLEG